MVKDFMHSLRETMGDSCWIFGHLAAGGAAGTVVYFIYFFPILIFIFILDGYI